MTQFTIVTQNEVSILSENPFFINDITTPIIIKKESSENESNKNNDMKAKNRSINIAMSLKI